MIWLVCIFPIPSACSKQESCDWRAVKALSRKALLCSFGEKYTKVNRKRVLRAQSPPLLHCFQVSWGQVPDVLHVLLDNPPFSTCLTRDLILRDDALRYIAHMMLIWAHLIAATRWSCSPQSLLSAGGRLQLQDKSFKISITSLMLSALSP